MVKNVHVSAIEQNGKVVFLHKIKEGAADKSYGIHVAQLAELPAELITRANEILTKLEQKDEQIKQPPAGKKMNNVAEDAAQLSFFDEPAEKKPSALSTKEKRIIEKVRDIDILDMTPMEALNTLYELHKKLKG